MNFLPYDYTRCEGSFDGEDLHTTCKDCLRKLSPWNEFRQSVFMTPPLKEGGACDSKIGTT